MTKSIKVQSKTVRNVHKKLKHYPSLKLEGRYMEEAGFPIGYQAKITVLNGIINIR